MGRFRYSKASKLKNWKLEGLKMGRLQTLKSQRYARFKARKLDILELSELNLNPPKFEVENFENWKSDNFKAVRV